MEKTISLLVIIFFFSHVNSQIIYSDNFESYDVGIGITRQCDYWRTWSGAILGAEDPVISEEYVNSGQKSVKISKNYEGTDDALIQLANLTEGRYYIEFSIYIPSGQQAYYNILQKFAGNLNTIWGIQIFFSNGKMKIDGGGEAAKLFEYENDKWIKLQHIVDLDNDWIDLYIDNNYIYGYKWSKGTFDHNDGINNLDALNFYAWSAGGNTEYYVDDIIIERLESVSPPENFSYIIENENDVILMWDDPQNGYSATYAIAKDGNIIGRTTELLFKEENVLPGTYKYELFACYGTEIGCVNSGLSLNVNITEGIERKYVLFEIFTSTGCGYCPIATQAIDQIVQDGYDVAVIEYHGNMIGSVDPFTTSSTKARSDFYIEANNIERYGYPSTFINGEEYIVGVYNNIPDQKSYYISNYNIIKSKPSLYKINSDINKVDSDPYVFNLEIEIEELSENISGDIKLFAALTETNIPYRWQSMTESNFVLRNLLPDANGQSVDFSETIYNTDFNLTIEPSHNINNIEIIIFLQHISDEDVQILQVDKIKLSDFVDIKNNGLKSAIVYPNPAKDYIEISSPDKISKIEMFGLDGKLLYTGNYNSDIVKVNLSDFAKGVYFVKLYFSGKVVTHKIVVE